MTVSLSGSVRAVTGTKIVTEYSPLTPLPSAAVAVMMAVPPETPVTVALPSAPPVTAAIEVSEEVQVKLCATLSVVPPSP